MLKLLGRGMAPAKSTTPTPVIPFAPTDYANLIYWGKPQDEALTTSLALLSDNSGQGNDATQTVEGEKPDIIATGIGSKNAISFDGIDDILRINAIAP
ncbi:MAG TPA: hypothetical protein ENJ46_03110, partial [Hellea balneolensis]|nr:hypothetical protein [Hellea balneolensis]